MTLLELLNVDLKELDEVLDADEKLTTAFNSIIDRIGYFLEGGRAHWREVDHDMNCAHCKEKVTIH